VDVILYVSQVREVRRLHLPRHEFSQGGIVQPFPGFLDLSIPFSLHMPPQTLSIKRAHSLSERFIISPSGASVQFTGPLTYPQSHRKNLPPLPSPGLGIDTVGRYKSYLVLPLSPSPSCLLYPYRVVLAVVVYLAASSHFLSCAAGWERVPLFCRSSPPAAAVRIHPTLRSISF